MLDIFVRFALQTVFNLINIYEEMTSYIQLYTTGLLYIAWYADTLTTDIWPFVWWNLLVRVQKL